MQDTESQRAHLESRIAMFKADLASQRNPSKKAEIARKIAADEKALRLMPFATINRSA